MSKLSFFYPRLSLRLLLLLFVPLCLWLAVVTQLARRQQASVAHLRSGGCHIVYEFEKERTFQRLDDVPLPAPKWAIDTLGLDYFSSVHSVKISHRPLTTGDVEALKRLKNLRVLVIDSCEPPANLSSLGILTKLEIVAFRRCSVNDDDLAWVWTLPKLRLLEVKETWVTDAWMAMIPENSNLEGIFLGKTSISDEGAAYLQKCRKLQGVGVGKSKITPVGIERLKQQFKDLEVLGLGELAF